MTNQWRLRWSSLVAFSGVGNSRGGGGGGGGVDNEVLIILGRKSVLPLEICS